MSLLRFKMVDAAINHNAVEVKAPEGRPSDYFGEKVFGRAAMRKYLDKKTYAALQACANGHWSTVPTTTPTGSNP